MNKETQDILNRLEEMPAVISPTSTARLIHVSPSRFMALLQRDLPPYAVETTLPGEGRRTFRIYTERLAKWLTGEEIPEVHPCMDI